MDFSEDGTIQTGRGGESESEKEFDPFTSKQEPPTDIQQLTTDAVPVLPNLRLLKLHSALMTKSFEGDQQFFKEAPHTVPTVSTSTSNTEHSLLVRQEDSAVFSDHVTTLTMPAATSVEQGKPSKSRSRTSEKIAVTSQPLTNPTVPTSTPTSTSQIRTLTTTTKKDKKTTLPPLSLSTSPKKEPQRPEGKTTSGYSFETYSGTFMMDGDGWIDGWMWIGQMDE